MGRVGEVFKNAPAESAVTVALGSVGGAMAIYGEYVQNNLDTYWQLVKLHGVGLANVALGQLSDMGTMLAFVAFGAAFFGYATKGDKDDMFMGGLVAGIFAPLAYNVIEILSKNTDGKDMLAFSVPLIAAGVLGIHAFMKRRAEQRV